MGFADDDEPPTSFANVSSDNFKKGPESHTSQGGSVKSENDVEKPNYNTDYSPPPATSSKEQILPELNAISQLTQMAQLLEKKISFDFEDEGEKNHNQQMHRYKRHTYRCKASFGNRNNHDDDITTTYRWHMKKRSQDKSS